MIRFYLGEEPLLEQVADLRVRARRRLPLRARAPRRAGGQGGRRGGRLRHADGPAGDAPPSARSSARASSPSRAATSRSTASSCRPARPGSPTQRAARAAPRRPAAVHAHRPRRTWVLPGGLTRVALRRGLVRRQLQPGRRLEGHLGADGRRVVISRVADHCFWFGRYLERAESTARLLQVTRTLALDAELPPLQCWRPLVIVVGRGARRSSSASARTRAGDGEVVQRYMTWAPRESGVSLRSSVRAARENARSIREVLALEVWEAINELYLWLGGDATPAACTRENRDEFYRHIRRSTQLVPGPPAQHHAARRAAGLHLAGRAARARRARPRASLDMHHHIHGAAEGAARDRGDGAVAVAAARLLGLRAVHEAPPGSGQPRRPLVRSCSRGALPALAALLRPVGAGAGAPARARPAGKGRPRSARDAPGGARPLARQAGSKTTSRCRCTGF